jgi:hypothetical protein
MAISQDLQWIAVCKSFYANLLHSVGFSGYILKYRIRKV